MFCRFILYTIIITPNLKTKRNDYEFMMTNRINDVEAVKKTNKPKKPIKGMPEWFRIWKDTELETRLSGIESRIGGIENKIDTIVKLNNLRTA